MRLNLSITRRSIDAVKRVFGGSGGQANPLSLRTITYAPAAASEAPGVSKTQTVSEIPPVQELPSTSPIEHDKPDDDFLELKNICEAIGLDPRELLGDSAASDTARGPAPAFRESAGISLKTAEAPGTREPAFKAGDVAAILASLKLRLLKLRLAPDDIAETEAEIDTAVAQLFSPRPKPEIIAVSVRTIVSILSQAGPGALTTDVETSLDKLRSFLKQLNH